MRDSPTRDVGEFLEEAAREARAKLERLRERLLRCTACTSAFTRARSGAARSNFDTPELKLEFDEQRQGRRRWSEYPRNDAHRLIEECMIAANVAAARFLDRHKVPTLYRVHGAARSSTGSRRCARSCANSASGCRPPARSRRTTCATCCRRSRDRPDAGLISTAVIRSMPQAVYQPGNIGHFGLALEHYAHFTSPIRRYPDLWCIAASGRCCAKAIRRNSSTGTASSRCWDSDCSFRERRADEATRSAVAWLKCFYMQDRIGEEFDGIVSGVVDFGLFVQLDGLQVDGLLHVSALGADYFGRDSSGFRMIGRSSGKIFRLGDRVRVRVTNVSLDDRRVDFELAGAMATPRRPAAGRFSARAADGGVAHAAPARSA